MNKTKNKESRHANRQADRTHLQISKLKMTWEIKKMNQRTYPGSWRSSRRRMMRKTTPRSTWSTPLHIMHESRIEVNMLIRITKPRNNMLKLKSRSRGIRKLILRSILTLWCGVSKVMNRFQILQSRAKLAEAYHQHLGTSAVSIQRAWWDNTNTKTKSSNTPNETNLTTLSVRTPKMSSSCTKAKTSEVKTAKTNNRHFTVSS